MFSTFGISISKSPLPERENISQIGGPALGNYLSLDQLDLSPSEKKFVKNFRTDRYFWLNEYRWRLLAKTGISFQDKIIFEPGAGIGDQTAWLLNQGAGHVIVSDGRQQNLEIIQKRFQKETRVSSYLINLEESLDSDSFKFTTDIVFLWGVYYHLMDPPPNFPLLQRLSNVAPMIILDFQLSLTGFDYIRNYNYENNSTSIGKSSWALTTKTMVSVIRSTFGFVYFPVEQMNWEDPSTLSAPRRIIIGSKEKLDFRGLIEA